ncbi:MAG: glycosyltransferase [Armatimonadaceae bacterium]
MGTTSKAQTLGVLIPTYRRHKDLLNGLEALKKQKRMPDQVVVTVRDTDTDTQAALKQYDAGALPLQIATVSIPGVVAAMNAGLAAITTDITVLTDDDTTPFPDWLERIEALFASDARIGGVGGRDFQAIHPGSEPIVGILQPFGRIIGNHHLAVGPARDVQILKGANCAFRTAPLKAIGFDERMAGKGAQVNWEMAICLAFLRAGWRLVFDPAIAVDHHVAPRADNDLNHRGIFGAEGHREAVHNYTLLLWEHFPPQQKLLFLLWFTLVGTHGEPGLVGLMLGLLKRRPEAFARFQATQQGRFAGIRTTRQTPRREVPAPGNSTGESSSFSARTLGK